MKTDLTQQYISGILEYDPVTGYFIWLVSRRAGWEGKQAGSPCSGYINIKIDGSLYKAHRLAWLYMTGEWPPDSIDHKDGDGSNNKWSNLRACNMAQNKANSRKYKNSKTGFKGVYGRKDGTFTASIQANGKRKFLGIFKTPEDAFSAYLRAADDLHGEFARAA